MDLVNPIVHDGKLVSTKKGLQFSRYKHNGTGFVNYAANSTLPKRQRKHPAKPTYTQLQPSTIRNQEGIGSSSQPSPAMASSETSSSKHRKNKPSTKLNGSHHPSPNTSPDPRLAGLVQEKPPIPRSLAAWRVHAGAAELTPGPDPGLQGVLAQAVATLAILAHLNRQYDQWHVHMNGLRQLITVEGTHTAVSPSVRWIMHKADLNGAAELAVPVHLPFPREYPPVAGLLDAETRAETREIMHRPLSACCDNEFVLELYVNITFFLLVVDRARAQRHFKADPDVLMEGWHYNGYQFLSVPPSFKEFRPPSSGPDGTAVELRTCFCCVETCLRLGVVLYGKRINPDPMDISQGHPRLLRLLAHQMRVILRGTRQEPDPSSLPDEEAHSYVASRSALFQAVGPALIWLSVMWVVVSELSDGLGDEVTSEHSIFRDILVEVVGNTAAEVYGLSERQLDLARLWDLKKINGKKRDIRETMLRIIQDL